MIFPVAECKFVYLIRGPGDRPGLVRLYRVDDGGLDDLGHQRYARTLKRQRPIAVPAGWTDEQIEAKARAYVIEWAFEEFGVVLPPERVICDL